MRVFGLFEAVVRQAAELEELAKGIDAQRKENNRAFPFKLDHIAGIRDLIPVICISAPCNKETSQQKRDLYQWELEASNDNRKPVKLILEEYKKAKAQLVATLMEVAYGEEKGQRNGERKIPEPAFPGDSVSDFGRETEPD